MAEEQVDIVLQASITVVLDKDIVPHEEFARLHPVINRLAWELGWQLKFLDFSRNTMTVEIIGSDCSSRTKGMENTNDPASYEEIVNRLRHELQLARAK